MTNTYDLTTVTGQIRLLALDKGPTIWIHSDEEILVFYSLEENDVRSAAALALEVTAGNKALLDKVKKLDGIELVTGIEISKQLMSRAEKLRSSVESGSAFAVADWS